MSSRIAAPRVQAPRRLLILGGTGEAAALAAWAVERFGARVEVVTSLAGRLARETAIAGKVRVGGFGGADGLAAYLRAHHVDAVVDATHPFAARISAHAREACANAAVPRLVLDRPPWRPTPQDRWIEVADMAGAAQALPGLGRRAWLTVGSGEIAAFAGLEGVWFLVRLISMPKEPLPLGLPGRDYEIVLGRGPFTLEGERALMARNRIDVLVSKQSGGPATEAKLVAAREAGLPVVMVRRPRPEPGERVESVSAALDWLERALGP
jgi:precorrin-6A/cobalt-precorrin-6A reductase